MMDARLLDIYEAIDHYAAQMKLRAKQGLDKGKDGWKTPVMTPQIFDDLKTDVYLEHARHKEFGKIKPKKLIDIANRAIFVMTSISAGRHLTIDD
jgi:hypothetical protein